MRIQDVLVVATENQNKALPITANRVAVIPVDASVDKDMAELVEAAKQVSDCPRELNEIAFDDSLLVVTSTVCASMLQCAPDELRKFLFHGGDYKVLFQTVPYEKFEKLEDVNLHPEAVMLVVRPNRVFSERDPDIHWRYDIDPGAKDSKEATASIPLRAFTKEGRDAAKQAMADLRKKHIEERRWSYVPSFKTYGP